MLVGRKYFSFGYIWRRKYNFNHNFRDWDCLFINPAACFTLPLRDSRFLALESGICHRRYHRCRRHRSPALPRVQRYRAATACGAALGREPGGPCPALSLRRRGKPRPSSAEGSESPAWAARIPLCRHSQKARCSRLAAWGAWDDASPDRSQTNSMLLPKKGSFTASTHIPGC